MNQAGNEPIAEIRSFIEAKLLGGRAIAPDEDLLLSGLLDSLAVMSLVTEVERVTGRPVPPTDVLIDNFMSLEAIAAYVNGRSAA
ncbi:hypothetical protein HKCCE3408_11315 [Rhodobacterales bacterium HKCCE3408]|nr:hypothetical protein [Rhodobacterales bacterium HKCCE3408]